MTSKQVKSMLNELPLHSVILIAYFILYGYMRNLEFFALQEVLNILTICYIAAGASYAVLYLVRGRQSANRMIFIVVLTFFLFGHIFDQAVPVFGGNMKVFTVVYFVIAGLIAIYLGFSPQDLSNVNYNLNLVMLILGVTGLVQFIVTVNETITSQQYIDTELEINYVSDPPAVLPDVYYLIFDGYPSNSYLQEEFSIDNSDFTDALEDRGFYVVYDSQSNYTYTLSSIASNLNMDFAQNFVEPNPDVSSFILENYINDNHAGRIFQEMGYTYIYVANGFFTIQNNIANVIYDVTQDNKVVKVDPADGSSARATMWEYIFQTTALRIIDPSLTRFTDVAGRSGFSTRERFMLEMTTLEDISKDPATTFTYFHIIKPHLPITFDAEGNDFSWDLEYNSNEEYLDNQEKHFEDQLQYINTSILDSMDSILANSDIPPIIIIQADHGTQLRRNRVDESNNPVAILNAFYFPDGDYDLLYPDISPVNTFPVIFNQYFNENYELLDDSLNYFQPQEHFRRLVFSEIPEGMYNPPFE